MFLASDVAGALRDVYQGWEDARQKPLQRPPSPHSSGSLTGQALQYTVSTSPVGVRDCHAGIPAKELVIATCASSRFNDRFISYDPVSQAGSTADR